MDVVSGHHHHQTVIDLGHIDSFRPRNVVPGIGKYICSGIGEGNFEITTGQEM